MYKLDINNTLAGEVGSKFEGMLLIKVARIAKTKAGKDYLAATLYDGATQINVNVWNWAYDVPKINSVINIVGTVGIYNDNKQLNISAYTVKNSTSELLSQFVPQGNFSIDEYEARFRGFAESIGNELFRHITLESLDNFLALWRNVPGALSVHNDYVAGCLQHCVDVCNNALALYANYPHLANVDLVIAGSLLHDIGKLFTYTFDGPSIVMTPEGQLLDHISLGMLMLERYNTDETHEELILLQHVIAAHHGKLEYGSPVTPKCIEAIIINYADGMDAKARVYEAADKTNENSDWTDKVFFLDNRPLVHTKYVDKILNK